MKRGKWPGTWKTVCDVCGFWFPSDAMRQRWDNLMTCEKDWEPRHPQDFIRGVPDNPAPPWVRPDPADSYLAACNIVTNSGYSDMASADCAQADNTTFSYAFLLDLNAGF